MFFGCGNSVETENIELTLWTPPIFATGYLDALNKLISEYEVSHNNVSINVVELNWDGISEKLESAIMSETTPDIYIDGTARTAKLPSTGLVENVSDIISSLDGWNESCIEIGKLNGDNYLVPLTQMPPTDFSINVSLVKKYGCYDLLPKDRVSWTWDEFITFLREIGEKSSTDGIYPLNLFAGNQSSDITYYTMLLSAGANILSSDHSKCAINSEEAIEIINKLQVIYDEGLTYPGAETLTDDDSLALFYGGKTIIDAVQGPLTNLPVLQAMFEEGTIDEVPEIEGYAWPTLDGSKTTIGNWGANCVSIFTNDGDNNKIAAAKDFVKYMLENKEFSETIWSSAPSYAPARNFGQVLNLEDKQIKREAEINSKIASYCTSNFGILESFWAEIRQYFYPELQSLFLHNESPKDVIENFEKGINEVLSNN